MPRKPRAILAQPNQPQHILTRGNNQRRLFSYEPDYVAFLQYLFRALRDTDCRLHQLSLHSKHISMIVVPPDATRLARFMKSCSQRYAVHRNARSDGTGRVFHNHYFSDGLVDETSLAQRIAFSDSTAVRSGLADDLAMDVWSTYALHAGMAPRHELLRQIWTPSPWYLSLGATAETRARSYRDFVGDCLAGGILPSRWEEIHAIETLSAQSYTKRLMRPDGTRANDGPAPRWRRK